MKRRGTRYTQPLQQGQARRGGAAGGTAAAGATLWLLPRMTRSPVARE
jgi:hypothetical protein